MSVPACIANAIADALGVKDISLPASPRRIHALLDQVQAQQNGAMARAAGGRR
jgi:2-furoyl-CoA dehydrogenase large subunit